MVLTKEILAQICLDKEPSTTHDCWGRYETTYEYKSADQIYKELCELFGYEVDNETS